MPEPSQKESNLVQRAAQLRQAFDRSFAVAPEGVSAATEAFLAIAVGSAGGGDLYALRLAQIAGLFADRKIVPLPSESSDLLGLTSFRGALIPVYDLRSLLGYAAAAASRPRWLVLVAAKTPIAVAFEQFDGYLAVTRDLIAREASRSLRPHVTGTLRDSSGTTERLRPIVSLVSIIELITQRQSISTHESIKERAQPGALQQEQ